MLPAAMGRPAAVYRSLCQIIGFNFRGRRNRLVST